MITLDDYWLTFALSAVLPAIVALVTNRLAAGWVKSVTLLALAAITGTVTQIQTDGGTFDPKTALILTIISFVTAVAAHYGLLSQVKLTGADGVVATKVPGGIGSAVEDE